MSLHGAHENVFPAGRPPDAHSQGGQTGAPDRRFWLETAGNGDGRLQPGETFRCVVEIDNWSLTSYEEVTAELAWNSGSISLADKP